MVVVQLKFWPLSLLILMHVAVIKELQNSALAGWQSLTEHLSQRS